MTYTKYTKTQRLRSRLTFKYNNGDYRSAARLGEALLRAHVREQSVNSPAFARDMYNVSLAQKAAGSPVRAAELRTEASRRANFHDDGLLTDHIKNSKNSCMKGKTNGAKGAKKAKIKLGLFYYFVNTLPGP